MLNKQSYGVELPQRMRHLPVARSGFTVPWFADTKKPDGDWNLREVRPARVVEALVHEKCWICGGRLGRHRTFAIGPMCAVNRVTAEPPSHADCARYAVRVCPFLSNPRMRRAPGPDDRPVAGIMLERNPGVTLLWATERGGHAPFRSGDGYLTRLEADPLQLEAWASGRPATEDEVRASVESGLPALQEVAALQGAEAEAELAATVRRGLKLLNL